MGPTGGGLPQPHKPTMTWVVVIIILAFLVYHFGLNRKR